MHSVYQHDLVSCPATHEGSGNETNTTLYLNRIYNIIYTVVCMYIHAMTAMYIRVAVEM